MSAVIAAMITAVVGVLGTLFAPVLTGRVAARQREEERAEADRLRRLEERRAAYTAMNRASRQFSTLLKDALHRLRDGVYTDQERTALEEARLDHRDRYAEAQMIAPEHILEASRAVNRVLAGTDAAVKRLDRGHARADETPDSVRHTLTTEGDPELATMRHLMRTDLGIHD
ncbi:hypothetical protein [Streptomyces sp. 891-h]|uniref:hypothetical protein n=1 Tax=unclassified Streptomyces TaxID=2593676 RepID=UPI001FAAB6B1|nr:hypothetical protein [Streptomyces sp. 891-h]UNZ18511.1 hypothetical protein HC362_17170 [Streptomyces sp. 891-h]